MGRAPCCSKVGLNRGPWTAREDALLTNYIQAHGDGYWRTLPKRAGLDRCGKSCRLRWMNYLKPDIKRGNISPDEEDLIIKLHYLLGNRWSLIAGRLPGRTDNEIKNLWKTRLSKKLLSQGTNPDTHKQLSDPVQELKNRMRRSGRGTSSIRRRRSKNKEGQNGTRTARAERNERTKIYLPRPTRITSNYHHHHHHAPPIARKCSFGSNAGSWACGEPPQSLLLGGEQGGFGGVDDDGDGIDGPDLGSESGISIPDSTSLEKLYDEYLQLLMNTEEDQSRSEQAVPGMPKRSTQRTHMVLG